MSEHDLDYMCPNCVTPWKCNGPHIEPPPARSRAEADRRELVTADGGACEPPCDMCQNLFTVVESIKAAAYRAGQVAALEDAAKEIYNGAGDPEQAFYDYGLHPWLMDRARAAELSKEQHDQPDA